MQAYSNNTMPVNAPFTNPKLGVIVKWNEKSGFGFISQENAPNDIFVHRCCLTDRNALAVGQLVTYDFFWDDRKNKFQASFCHVIDNPTQDIIMRMSHKFDVHYDAPSYGYYQKPYQQLPYNHAPSAHANVQYENVNKKTLERSNSTSTISGFASSASSVVSLDDELHELLPFDIERQESHAFSTPRASNDSCFDDNTSPLLVECEDLFDYF
jgi:cold shock CspA family protein